MRNSSILASCILLASASAIAQGVLIPSTAQGPFAGTSGNYFTAAGINHFQMIYDTSNLTTQGVLAPINITNIQFLYGGGTTPAAVTTFPLVEVYVQQSAVDWTLQNTSFAANNTVPLPTTPNYTGPVTTQVGTYYVDIPLTIPFAYDPTTGTDLLIEVFVNGVSVAQFGGTGAVNVWTFVQYMSFETVSFPVPGLGSASFVWRVMRMSYCPRVFGFQVMALRTASRVFALIVEL